MLCSDHANCAATTTYQIDLDDVLADGVAGVGIGRRAGPLAVAIDFAKVKWTLTRSDGRTRSPATYDVKGGKV